MISNGRTPRRHLPATSCIHLPQHPFLSLSVCQQRHSRPANLSFQPDPIQLTHPLHSLKDTPLCLSNLCHPTPPPTIPPTQQSSQSLNPHLHHSPPFPASYLSKTPFLSPSTTLPPAHTAASSGLSRKPRAPPRAPFRLRRRRSEQVRTTHRLPLPTPRMRTSPRVGWIFSKRASPPPPQPPPRLLPCVVIRPFS
ncbi:hypothetical protein GGR50DRAFT_651613 [Xylaria sp. CBS 124048]|nr:hypothetical protein GGR50DRAFT_651613 [Xylaria sp. CBS 124048]